MAWTHYELQNITQNNLYKPFSLAPVFAFVCETSVLGGNSFVRLDLTYRRRILNTARCGSRRANYHCLLKFDNQCSSPAIVQGCTGEIQLYDNTRIILDTPHHRPFSKQADPAPRPPPPQKKFIHPIVSGVWLGPLGVEPDP